MSSAQTSQPKKEEPGSGSESQTQTQTQSQIEPGSQPLDLHSLPLIYVLPTHLTLDALHQVEDHLVRGAAPLTYDLSEAGLVLGRLTHKKRAALELRARGVWTEEAPSGLAVPDRGEPPVKRARVSELNGPDGKVSDGRPKEVVELDTETESEEDGVDGHPTGKHLQRPESGSTIPTGTTRTEQGIIQVIKLDWLYRCLSSKSLLPTDPFLIYRARKVSPPASKSAGIIQRARQDAATRPQKQYPPTQYHPPKLHRTTTSEAEEEETNLPPPPDWVVNRLPYACQRRAPLHPPNEAFIQQLLKIRQIRYLTLDEIGVRAYSTSIAAIAAYPYKLRRASEVLALPGCDAKIAHLFSEYQSSGTLAAASQLDSDPTLRTLNTFAQIWGVGAKTARDYYFARHWRDLDDIILHGWGSLSRVQQIGVKYYDEFRCGVARSQVEAIASTVQRHANLVRPHAHYDSVGVECILVGGYRRGKDVCGDVDLILTHRDESITHDLVVDVLASLESSHYVTHTLHLNLSTSDREQQALPYRGDVEGGKPFDSLDKALVVWQDPVPASHSNAGPTSPQTNTNTNTQTQVKNKNQNTHHRVDIIVSPWRSIGCAVLGWTGDTTFERDLRRLAKKKHNWKFDSSGVRQRDGKGRVLDLEAGGRTWEEREKLVFEAVVGEGTWIGPEGRCSF